MIKLIFGKKDVRIPSAWSEMGLKNILYYLRYYYTQVDDLIEQNDEGEYFIKDEIEWKKMQMGLLRGLIPMGDREFFKTLNDRIACELIDDHKVVDFLVKEVTPIKLPVTEIKGLYGPVEFNYLCTAEFALADIQYILAKRALRDDDEERLMKHLHLFTATLYRPRSLAKYGDKRILFDKHSVESRATKLKHLRKYEMLAIVLWYESHRATLPKKFPDAFETTISDETTEKTQSLPDWQTAMINIAEGGIFGDFNNVERTPALYFIKAIDLKKRQMREEIEHYKRNKTNAV